MTASTIASQYLGAVKSERVTYLPKDKLAVPDYYISRGGFGAHH